MTTKREELIRVAAQMLAAQLPPLSGKRVFAANLVQSEAAAAVEQAQALIAEVDKVHPREGHRE